MANQLIHFGKYSILYEEGFVRYVRAGEFEILRKIYFALRDSSWVTADIIRSDERISVTLNRFEISYTATNVVGGKEVFRWHVKINGNESGEIDFSVDGQALAEYTRNRAGICVLHPIRETREKPVKVTRPDDLVYDASFKTAIDPHLPFMDIRKMEWQLEGNAWAILEYEGDVFETEDQRNWSDTSFKTYSTPLSIPFPVTLKPGDRVTQRVKLTLRNPEGLPTSELAEDIEVIIHEGDSKPFPKIGTEFSGVMASQEEVNALKLLHFNHLRIELNLSASSWKDHLRSGLEAAKAISSGVFIHLIMDKPEQWDQVAAELKSESIDNIAISPVDRKANVDDLIQPILPKIRKLFPDVPVGAGFNSYFTELNRNRFDYTKVDFLIYPLNPQAHANDTYTIIENLPAQEDAVKTAKGFSSGKLIHAGPVTLKQRFNPDSKGGTVDPSARFDPRHQTPLAAGWALSSIKYLSEGGIDSITLFESHGLAGYVNGDHLFPVYSALLAVSNIDPKRVIRSTCNEPLIISSLVLEDESGMRHLLLINHSNTKKSVNVGESLYTLGDMEVQFISMK